MKKAVVLLSSGLDSTVNLYKANQELDVVLALNFDYGQRAAIRETECAKALAAGLNIPFQTLSIPWFHLFSNSSLTQLDKQLATNMDIDSMEESTESAKNVWVPNRNGIFLNIAAAFAEGLGAEYVIPGFNAEEAATFPDNTGEYLDACSSAFQFSTSNKVEAKCYTTNLNKVEIYSLGKELGVDYSLVWPCYTSLDKACGECESCLRFLRAKKTVEERNA